ncbi:MAG: sn-glycerol-3-phosphate ABC transporter ATP-binding protein UgpC [Clostridiaceae bacterium]|nr:sn-glycerol-3-phosphate ABC transporter ATP-binding protein UgpC [Clostridiaceae bacterium]
MASVKLKNVYKKYESAHGGVMAVNDFNLDIDDKEFLILVGPSGCGKTTTLRMVAGLEEITAGEIYIGDKLINDVQPKDRDIAMVFQNYALYPHMTVFDNMAFGLKLRKTPKHEIKKKVYEAARILEIEHLLDRKPKALSGGQRQRVALGRAIVREPKVFLMDEPLSNLDAKLRVQMRVEITRLHQKLKTTIIYVTHDQTEAMTMGTRIVVMKDGFIQQVDSPQVLYEKPVNVFVGGFIGSPPMNFVKTRVRKDEKGVFLIFGEAEGSVLQSRAQAAEQKLVKPTMIYLPPERASKIEELGYIDKEVIMGIRPENIKDDPRFFQQFPDAVVEGVVDVREALGAETLLYLKISDVDFTARVDPSHKFKPDDEVKMVFDPTRLHIFDAKTEKVLPV